MAFTKDHLAKTPIPEVPYEWYFELLSKDGHHTLGCMPVHIMWVNCKHKHLKYSNILTPLQYFSPFKILNSSLDAFF